MANHPGSPRGVIEVIGGILVVLFPLFGAFLVAQWFLGSLFPRWSFTSDWRVPGLLGAAALMWVPMGLYVTRSWGRAGSAEGDTSEEAVPRGYQLLAVLMVMLGALIAMAMSEAL